MELRILDLYGDTCVVDESEPELHHLDEDPANTTLYNLLPINGGLNVQIENKPFQVQCLKIRAAAERWERLSKFTNAYGCYRLLAWLYQKQADSDCMLQNVTSCLRNLRPLSIHDFVQDVLERHLIPLLRVPSAYGRVDAATFAGLCEEIGAYLRENGHRSAFDDWNLLKVGFLKFTGDNCQSIFAQIQVLRHEAFALSEAGDHVTAKRRVNDAINFARYHGQESLITRRKSHHLLLMREHLFNREWDAFDQVIHEAGDGGLFLLNGNAVSRAFHPKSRRHEHDSWAECHMQSLYVASLLAQNKAVRAKERLEQYVAEYKKPFGIRATKAGYLPLLKDRLADMGLPALWTDIPRKNLALIAKLLQKVKSEILPSFHFRRFPAR